MNFVLKVMLQKFKKNLKILDLELFLALKIYVEKTFSTDHTVALMSGAQKLVLDFSK